MVFVENSEEIEFRLFRLSIVVYFVIHTRVVCADWMYYRVRPVAVVCIGQQFGVWWSS